MWPLQLHELYQSLSTPLTPPPHSDIASTSIHGVTTDSRRSAPHLIFAAIRGDTHDGHTFVASALEKGATAALVDPRWNGLTELSEDQRSRCVVVPDVTQALREWAFHHRSRFPFPVVGIGGSNGKTTTKEILAGLLSTPSPLVKTHKSENGWLGMALTLLDTQVHWQDTPKALLLEIGIDSTDAMAHHVALGRPDWTLLTALGPEHLAGLGTWETGIEEELKLFAGSSRRIWQLADPILTERFPQEVRAGDVAVLPASAPHPAPSTPTLRWETLKSEATEQWVRFEWTPKEDRKNSFSLNLPMPGAHNAANFALAIGTALAMGRTVRELQESWIHFTPPEARSRTEALKKGGVLYNDCYNASPFSMSAALQALEHPEWKGKDRILILGDMLDLGDESRKWHSRLAEELSQQNWAALCLFGTAMYDVFHALKNSPLAPPSTPMRRLFWRGADEDPRALLRDLQSSGGLELSSSLVLVKGSRGMALERILNDIRTCER